MSLLKRLKKGIGKASKAFAAAGPLATFVPGGAALGIASQYANLIPTGSSRKRSSGSPQLSLVGGTSMGVMSANRLPMPRPGGSTGVIVRGGGGRVITTPSGSRLNAAKIWAAVRQLGPEAVAAGLGLGAGELAEWLLSNPPKSRRRKGVTARQLSNARRVNRIVCNWSKQLTSTKARKRC